MAKKRASQRPTYSSDSSSDSDASTEATQIGPALYQQLGTAAALRRPADFAVACSELAQLTRHLFKRCSKALQGQLVEDMALAIESCDGRLQSRAALAGLMDAAERALPQAKRAALQRKYRESSVALSRRQRRGGGSGGGAGSDSEEDAPASFSHLPLDAVRQVFRHLDPITLACSACVCREWREAAGDDSLWHLHCDRLQGRAAATARARAAGAGAAVKAAGAAAAPAGASIASPGVVAAAGSRTQQAAEPGPASSSSSSYQHQFAAAVRQRPERLLRWRTNRILLAGGKLGWLDPSRLPAGSWRHIGTEAVLAFLRSGGRRLRAGGGDSSSSGGGSSDSSGGSGDEEGMSRLLRFWQL